MHCLTGILLDDEISFVDLKFLFTNRKLIPQSIKRAKLKNPRRASREAKEAAAGTELAQMGRLRPGHVDTGFPVVENRTSVRLNLPIEQFHDLGVTITKLTRSYNFRKRKWIVTARLERATSSNITEEHLKFVEFLQSQVWGHCWVYLNRHGPPPNELNATINMLHLPVNGKQPEKKYTLALHDNQFVLEKH